MEQEPLSYRKRQLKPYVVLIDPTGTRGAPYNGQHKLMAPEASPELVSWALAHHTKRDPWDDALDAHWHRERAPWMPTGTLAGWTLYWLRDGKTSDAHLRATPNG